MKWLFDGPEQDLKTLLIAREMEENKSCCILFSLIVFVSEVTPDVPAPRTQQRALPTNQNKTQPDEI